MRGGVSHVRGPGGVGLVGMMGTYVRETGRVMLLGSWSVRFGALRADRDCAVVCCGGAAEVG